jgi:toxin CcdB
MAQFMVYANANAASRKRVPYLLDVQSDLIDAMESRVMVPLMAAGTVEPVIGSLMPGFVVAGAPVVMHTAQLAGVPRRVIGEQVHDLSGERQAIMAALDFLVSGI